MPRGWGAAGPPTRLQRESFLLRIFVDARARTHQRPVYEAVVEQARAHGLAGTTVLDGWEGAIGRGELEVESPWRLAHARPVVVEIVESRERLEPFVEEASPMLADAVVTLERAEVAFSPAGRLPEADMTSEEGVLLRVFLGEGDRSEGRPLYHVIVEKARDFGMAGATVFRGIMGFGRGRAVHTVKWEALSAGLPIVVEIVDTESRIREFLPTLEGLGSDCLVTLEKVRVLGSPGTLRSEAEAEA